MPDEGFWVAVVVFDEVVDGCFQFFGRTALTFAAEGGKADIAKPLHCLGAGIWRLRCPIVGVPFVSSTPCNLG